MSREHTGGKSTVFLSLPTAVTILLKAINLEICLVHFSSGADFVLILAEKRFNEWKEQMA